MNVLAVVPAFQAEKSVAAVVSGLATALPRTDGPSVLVVDDGSTDQTARVAERAGAAVVRHPKNLGKGAALRTGLRFAANVGAGAIVSVDADGQHPTEEAIRIALDPAPREALVLAVRDLARDGAPWPNRFSNGFSNVFLSWFGGVPLRDSQCGLRRYPVPETLSLDARSDGYAFESEVLLRATRLGWRIVQVPVRVVYPPASERVSHFDAVRDPARIVLRVLESTWKVPRR